MPKASLKRPPTSGTLHGNGTGWGSDGTAKGAGKGPKWPKFELGNQAAVGRAQPDWEALKTKEEKAVALKQNLLRLGLTAEREETQISAAVAWLNREEGMPVQKNVNMNFKKDIKDFSDDELLAIAGSGEGESAGGTPDEDASAE